MGFVGLFEFGFLWWCYFEWFIRIVVWENGFILVDVWGVFCDGDGKLEEGLVDIMLNYVELMVILVKDKYVLL